MRFLKQMLAAAAVVVPFVSAQSLADLPECALTAATSSISTTGCKASDYSCLCRATSFLTALQGQVSTTCSASDYASTLAFAQKACSAVGITLSLPSSAAGAKPVTSATPASSAASYGAPEASSKSSSPTTSITIPTTTGALSNGTSNNTTVATSQPVVPFEGLANSHRFEWASAALLIGTVAAFAGL